MSSTRRAPTSATRAQERYASARSGEMLLGNLVAKKCETVRSRKHRRLIFFLHDLSLRVGCRTHPTINLFSAWPIGTAANADSVPFQRVAADLATLYGGHITSSAVELLPAFLTSLCLDPACDPEAVTLPGCSNVIGVLEDYREDFCKAAGARPVALTEPTSIIWDALDYALSQGGMVLVEGTWRIGKSFSAQAWAQRHVGECRYVQLSSAQDAAGFYRDISRCLGTACSTQRKASEMRMRIEAMLRTQNLLLIVDEAQYIWPQTLRPQGAPERVNWLMSALLNSGVSLALIASHDFTRYMRNVEERSRQVFGSEQWHGRLRHHRRLPDVLNESDLFKIAAAIMPEATAPMTKLLVAHALKSKGRMAAIEAAATRARFFAEQSGRHLATFTDVERAMIEAATASPSPREHSAAPSRLDGAALPQAKIFRRPHAADRNTAAPARSG